MRTAGVPAAGERGGRCPQKPLARGVVTRRRAYWRCACPSAGCPSPAPGPEPRRAAGSPPAGQENTASRSDPAASCLRSLADDGGTSRGLMPMVPGSAAGTCVLSKTACSARHDAETGEARLPMGAFDRLRLLGARSTHGPRWLRLRRRLSLLLALRLVLVTPRHGALTPCGCSFPSASPGPVRASPAEGRHAGR